MKKPLKVLLVFDAPFEAERGYGFQEEFKDPDWNTERDVFEALCELKHDVRLLGISERIEPLLEEV
ncbi:MAG: hypothetical protein JW928_02680, partial [Candidatus Aureabacteria bacterium]|nr:hypothetical protein [Candidatus Auribacterota bacterium]